MDHQPPADHRSTPGPHAPAGRTAADDPAVVRRPPQAPLRGPFGVRTIATTYASGFLMGSADIVPGVSGGTVALVLGIYERLIANVRQGARALSLAARMELRDALRGLVAVEWSFILPLLLGIGTAIVTLASGLEHLLETQPVYLAAGFVGLIVGSVLVSWSELEEAGSRVIATVVVSAVATFVMLGLRTGRFEDPSLLVVFAGGALAICAMILPGVSGSFILLMIGLYEAVLGSVTDLDLVTLVVFAAGATVGLGAFSTLLNWLLRRYRDVVLAVLIGLMAGSLRVLWPWPAGEDGVGDTALGAPVAGQVPLALALAVVGAVAVVVVARVARALSEADEP